MTIGKDILLLKARISEKKKRLAEMELRADSYTRMLRDIIDPYSGDFTEFDMDRAELIVQDFHAVWCEARALKAEIARMEKDLNG
jgi:hypothetical protein